VPSSKLFPVTVMKIRAAYHCNRMPILFMFRQFSMVRSVVWVLDGTSGAWKIMQGGCAVCKVYG
jgi:hypothetical protein